MISVENDVFSFELHIAILFSLTKNREVPMALMVVSCKLTLTQILFSKS